MVNQRSLRWSKFKVQEINILYQDQEEKKLRVKINP